MPVLSLVDFFFFFLLLCGQPPFEHTLNENPTHEYVARSSWRMKSERERDGDREEKTHAERAMVLKMEIPYARWQSEYVAMNAIVFGCAGVGEIHVCIRFRFAKIPFFTRKKNITCTRCVEL